MPEAFFSIDDSYSPPEPFDRAIANVDVRCRSNAIEDGIDLDIIVSFGADEVRIELSDGSTIEAMCEIKEAIVVIKTFNCDLGERSVSAPGVGFEYKQNLKGTRTSSSISAARATATGSLTAPTPNSNLAADASISGETKQQQEDTYEVTAERKFSQVQIGTDQIRIHPNPDLSPLVGNLLEAEKCFSVVPRRNDKPFGILAELQVSKGWMSLSDPRPTSTSTRLTQLLEKKLKGKDPIDEFHRRAFNLLMEHLVSMGLQVDANRKYATLAARAIRVEKVSADETGRRYIGLSERRICLPVAALEAVLFEPRDKVENILIDAGITDLSQLGPLSSSMVFYPSGYRTDGRLVELGAFLESSFKITILRETQDDGENRGAPRIFAPFEFARSFHFTPESKHRKDCNAIEFKIVRDGVEITYMQDNVRLTQVTKRGTFG